MWNELTWGQLGRSPDILGALHHLRAQPQNEPRTVHEDEEVAPHVVEETRDGGVVTGGKQLSTAAPHSNECFVSLSATFARHSNPKCVIAFAFAIPSNTPGLKMLAREPGSRWFGSWGHPLKMLDEQDCMLFFDHVLVPWDRLFMLYDPTPKVNMLGAAGGSVNFNFLGRANLCRVEVRMRVMTAVATMVGEAIGVIDYREVGAKLGEMVTYCEVWRHAMEGVEHQAGPTPSGQWTLGPARGLHIWFTQVSGRMVELCARICASGIIMRPSGNDLANPEIRRYLGRYMRGTDVDVQYKSRLFRLAHEFAASSFGLRQEVYEYGHGADPNRNRINPLRRFDEEKMKGRIRELLLRPLPHGE